MKREALERPFPPELIKSRAGSYGDELLFVEGVEYIRRLNDAFDGSWDWQIENYEIREREIVVHGALRAGGVTKHAFGGAAITMNKSGGVISLADNLKAAATDALKKACSLFGVGLELYSSSDPRSRAADSDARGTAATRLRPVPSNGNGDVQQESKRSAPPPSNGETRNRLTAKQLRALYAIAHSRGMSDSALKALSVERFSAAPEFLSRADASTLIDQLDER